jgi:hypothetical protein
MPAADGEILARLGKCGELLLDSRAGTKAYRDTHLDKIAAEAAAEILLQFGARGRRWAIEDCDFRDGRNSDRFTQNARLLTLYAK